MCHVAGAATNMHATKHQSYKSATEGQLMEVDLSFAMFVLGPLILLAGTGISVCDF